MSLARTGASVDVLSNDDFRMVVSSLLESDETWTAVVVVVRIMAIVEEEDDNDGGGCGVVMDRPEQRMLRLLFLAFPPIHPLVCCGHNSTKRTIATQHCSDVFFRPLLFRLHSSFRRSIRRSCRIERSIPRIVTIVVVVVALIDLMMMMPFDVSSVVCRLSSCFRFRC